MKLSSKTTFKNFITAYLPAIIWASIIFIFSSRESLPSLETSLTDYIFKKSAHIFVYAVLYFLLFRAIRQTYPTKPSLLPWLPLLIVMLYAASDEVHQHFVPGRYGTIRDIGYDMLGAGIVFLRQYRYI